MLHRAAFAVTVIFIILCFITPAAVVAPQFLHEPIEFIIHNANGASTGFYLNDYDLLIRHRGYGPRLDTDDHWPDLLFPLACLAIPPVLWFATHRPSRAASGGARRVAYLCAACPFLITFAVFYLRWDDGSPILFAAGCLIAGVIYALRRLARLPSRAQRRLQKGLCPRCAYDLRATPDRCPECGYRV